MYFASPPEKWSRAGMYFASPPEKWSNAGTYFGSPPKSGAVGVLRFYIDENIEIFIALGDAPA